MEVNMVSQWVNLCEREPKEGKEVQVLVIQRTGSDSHDIDYEKATLMADGWVFSGAPRYRNVVAWLESHQILSRVELSNVSKTSIRF
jgi:hypothetical protein